ncbi:MAG: hypothetical protein A2Z66_04360 [Chloroflexi bacterium RBG_13_66_10]|nr:MAG: hypothetical protein A2Z66_04360 [Chloroflexi bacterium RBG_13_66_10]
MGIGNGLEAKRVPQSVGEHPAVDQRWALPIAVQLALAFEPPLRQPHLQILLAQEDQKAGASLAEGRSVQPDPVL